MARQGERAIDATRGDLERVGLLAHHVGCLEHDVDGLGRLGDVVHGDATVLVDRDAEDAAVAGRSELDGFDVETEGTQGFSELCLDPVPSGVLVGTGHELRPPLCCC